ncbi:hypothetical protein [Phocaeicola coprocola]|uniref:hypothetical protein n=1 Tax=Phocaeicola coprocola TaxID=310298 RepID=UPI003AEF17B1
MNKIAECLQLYREKFPEDWISCMDWDTRPEAESQRGNVQIVQFANTCFEKLTISLLSGEYILNIQAIRDDIHLFSNLLTSHEYLSDGNQYKNMLSDCYELLDRSILKCLTLYNYIICLYENKYEEASISSFFVSNDELSTGRMIGHLRYFAQYVRPICKIEYNLSFKDSLIEDLFCMSKELSEVDDINPVIKKVLLDKVFFLLSKLLRVQEKSTIIYYDSIRYEIKNSELSSSVLKEFQEKFYQLYDKNNLLSFLNTNFSRLEQSLNQSSDTFTFPDMVLIMKCYQELSGRESGIENVLALFQKREIGSTRYDVYSYNVLKNYFYNSRFSNRLSSPTYSLDDFERDYSFIVDLQKETGINNFHPYKKSLSFLKHKISEQINSSAFSDYDRVFKLYSECIKKFKDSISWCSERDFYAFQFPYEDSLIQYESFSVFYPSSFSRPLRYDELRKELLQYERDYDVYAAQKIFIEEKQNMMKIKADVENAKSMIDDAKKESVKILGVFSTVVTFLFGSIDVFSKTKDFKETLLTSLGVGIVLYFFCTLIYLLLLSGDDYKNKPVKFYSILFIAMIGAMILAAYLGSLI